QQMASHPRIVQALRAGARKLPCRLLVPEARPVTAPAGLVSGGGKGLRSLGAGRSAEQQSHSRNCRTGTDKRIPKQSALDPRIKKAFAIKRKEAPRPKACLRSTTRHRSGWPFERRRQSVKVVGSRTKR